MLEMERVVRGQQEYKAGKVYTFCCPTCGHKLTYDQPGEPLCTGPHPSLDEHAPEVMRLEKVVNLAKETKHVPAVVAEQRAAGPLWVPPSRD